MSDLFGHNEPERPFVDIRRQQEKAASEKAELCLVLGGLVHKVPASINAAGVEMVRRWKKDRDKAVKVLGSSRSSRVELTTAITQMRAYE